MQQASMTSEMSRTYPTRPYLAVSAAIFRDGRVLDRAPGAAARARPLHAARRRRRTGRDAWRRPSSAKCARKPPLRWRRSRSPAIAKPLRAMRSGRDRAALRHFAVCGALDRRRNIAQRGIGRSALAFSRRTRRVDDHRGVGADRRCRRRANCRGPLSKEAKKPRPCRVLMFAVRSARALCSPQDRCCAC